MVLLVQQVYRARQDLRDQAEALVPLGQMEQLELVDLREPLETLDRKEPQVKQVH